MGTNYYLAGKPPCECCGGGYESKHVGKCSGGWCFLLHVYPDEGINDLGDWERLWSAPGAQITNEYGDVVSAEEMRRIVTERSWKRSTPYGYSNWRKFHEENHSQAGPKGLLRHRIDGHCIGHGSGTWDLIVGEFS